MYTNDVKKKNKTTAHGTLFSPLLCNYIYINILFYVENIYIYIHKFQNIGSSLKLIRVQRSYSWFIKMGNEGSIEVNECFDNLT